MNHIRFYFVLLVGLVLMAACGGQSEVVESPPPIAETAVIEPEESETADEELEDFEGDVEEDEAASDNQEDATTEENEADVTSTETSPYDGPVTALVIRRVATDLNTFISTREGYISILLEQDGVVADREFSAFLDFSTFASPDPAVFIGLTEFESLEALSTATDTAANTLEAETFFGNFDLELFGALRPLNPEDQYDLAELAIQPGQVLEVAARDLSMYEDFDANDYAIKRGAFLESLSQQEGFVQELQWVSLLDENIVVGMTVYASASAYQAINTSDFVNTPEYTDFVFTYPFVAGFASFDAKPTGVSNTIPSEAIAFPESIAIDGETAYLSNFFDGSIHMLNLNSGESSQLVEAGRDGVTAGWGLWLEDSSGLLLSCGNRNFVPGPQENNNAARSIDISTGETVELWELPTGAACNSILSVTNGDIYISDVSPNADIIKIDRVTGESIVWVDEPSWENDSGFGAGGLAWDGNSNLYLSAAGIIRIPINDDGTAGNLAPQTMLDANGNDTFFSFDGFAFNEADSTLIGAAFDFDVFQSQVIKLSILDENTVQGELIFLGATGATGIDASSGTIFIADGQIIQALFNEGYVPSTPFSIFMME